MKTKKGRTVTLTDEEIKFILIFISLGKTTIAELLKDKRLPKSTFLKIKKEFYQMNSLQEKLKK